MPRRRPKWQNSQQVATQTCRLARESRLASRELIRDSQRRRRRRLSAVDANQCGVGRGVRGEFIFGAAAPDNNNSGNHNNDTARLPPIRPNRIAPETRSLAARARPFEWRRALAGHRARFPRWAARCTSCGKVDGTTRRWISRCRYRCLCESVHCGPERGCTAITIMRNRATAAPCREARSVSTGGAKGLTSY